MTDYKPTVEIALLRIFICECMAFLPPELKLRGRDLLTFSEIPEATTAIVRKQFMELVSSDICDWQLKSWLEPALTSHIMRRNHNKLNEAHVRSIVKRMFEEAYYGEGKN